MLIFLFSKKKRPERSARLQGARAIPGESFVPVYVVSLNYLFFHTSVKLSNFAVFTQGAQFAGLNLSRLLQFYKLNLSATHGHL